MLKILGQWWCGMWGHEWCNYYSPNKFALECMNCNKKTTGIVVGRD